MKSFVCFAVFVLLSLSAFCQEYQSFRLAVGVGSIPAKKSSAGFLVYLEPSWHVSYHVAVAVRIETAAVPKADVNLIGSYTVNARYYVTENPVRFFVGAGGGYYTANRALLAKDGSAHQSKTLLGLYPRFGFDYRRITAQMDLNLIQDLQQKVNPVASGVQEYYTAQPTYLSFKVGLFIGGKKK